MTEEQKQVQAGYERSKEALHEEIVKLKADKDVLEKAGKDNLDKITELEAESEKLKAEIDALKNQPSLELTAQEIESRRKIEERKKADQSRIDYFSNRKDEVEQPKEDDLKDTPESTKKIKVE